MNKVEIDQVYRRYNKKGEKSGRYKVLEVVMEGFTEPICIVQNMKYRNKGVVALKSLQTSDGGNYKYKLLS